MKQHFLEKLIPYDGRQLHSHWIYQQTGILGDGIAAFIGAADVALDQMVDLMDVNQHAPIASRLMLHFLVEHFGCDLSMGVTRQRLLVVNACELLQEYAACVNVRRKGDDLYDNDRKLSVSIATSSPVSCCIHFGINIESAGTPLPTKGLTDYAIDPKQFALLLMERYRNELSEINIARCKVRPVA